MKIKLLISGVLAIFALALLFGCTMGQNSFTLGENFSAKEGNSYSDKNSGLNITIVLINDSRCPANVQCIWAGELGVSLLVRGQDFNQEINLGETTNPSAQAGTYTIKLVSVDPIAKTAELNVNLIEINPGPIVGGDKDIHGCIGSAGYSWCEAKQKCLRVWEESCADTNAGLANPASTNCINKGGTLNIMDTNEGQVGMCTLPGGKVCEEWALFRGDCNANTCGICPQLTPPAPGFCPNGNIVAGAVNECGCIGPPTCEPVACTMDAKACPDGNFVGRVAPDCNFAPCPGN